MASAKQRRRAPYCEVPAAYMQNGYVADLVFAITKVAEEHGANLSVHQKNGDVYIGVILPNLAEQAEIDRNAHRLIELIEEEAK